MKLIADIIFLVRRTWQVFSVWQVYMLMHVERFSNQIRERECVCRWHVLLSCYMHNWLASFQCEFWYWHVICMDRQKYYMVYKDHTLSKTIHYR
jgi:hypothetical protein